MVALASRPLSGFEEVTISLIVTNPTLADLKHVHTSEMPSNCSTCNPRTGWGQGQAGLMIRELAKNAFESCNGWFHWMSFIFRFLPFKKSNEKDSTPTTTKSYQVVWRREVNIESVLLGLSNPIFGVSQWCHFHSVSRPKSLNSQLIIWIWPTLVWGLFWKTQTQQGRHHVCLKSEFNPRLFFNLGLDDPLAVKASN